MVSFGRTWWLKVRTGVSRPRRQILMAKSSAQVTNMVAEIQRRSQIQPAWNWNNCTEFLALASHT